MANQRRTGHKHPFPGSARERQISHHCRPWEKRIRLGQKEKSLPLHLRIGAGCETDEFRVREIRFCIDRRDSRSRGEVRHALSERQVNSDQRGTKRNKRVEKFWKILSLRNRFAPAKAEFRLRRIN